MGKIEQRGRNRENRQRNPFIILACEGKTENIYFRNFGSRKYIIKFAKGNNTDPKGIVEDLLKYIKLNIDPDENDKMYAVFDTDVNQNKQPKIEEAKELAKENGVEIITSTPSFEIWFLLHFIYTTKVFSSNTELLNVLKEHIEDYEKTNNTYSLIKDNTYIAIANAKKLEEHQLKNGQALDNVNCNPYTGVYKIIEEFNYRNM